MRNGLSAPLSPAWFPKLLAWAVALAITCLTSTPLLAAQTPAPAADSARAHYRVAFGVGDDHWLRFGFERDIRPGWGVKVMAGGGFFTGIAALGPVVRLPTGRRTELGVFAGVARMTCSSFLDGGSSVCERPDGDAGWGLGGGAYWLSRFHEDGEWSFGPTLAYWNRLPGNDDGGFDIWTVGVTIHKKFRGRARTR